MNLHDSVRALFSFRYEGVSSPISKLKIEKETPYTWVIGHFNGWGDHFHQNGLSIHFNEKLINSFRKNRETPEKCVEDRIEKEIRFLLRVFFRNMMRYRDLREAFKEALEVPIKEIYNDPLRWGKCRPVNALLFYMILYLMKDRAQGMVLELCFDEEIDTKYMEIRAFREWYGIGDRTRDVVYFMMEELMKDFAKSYYNDAYFHFDPFEETDFPGVFYCDNTIWPALVNYRVPGIRAVGCEKYGDLELFFSSDILNSFNFIFIET